MRYFQAMNAATDSSKLMDLIELEHNIPHVDWKTLINDFLAPNQKIENDERMVVENVDYLQNIRHILSETSQR